MRNINVMFAISSNLLDDDATDMVMMYVFQGDSWTELLWGKGIPLPSQDCSCHRVDVVAEGLPPEEQSIVVSELRTAKLFQMKVHNCFLGIEMLMEVDRDAGCDETAAGGAADDPLYRRRRFVFQGALILAKNKAKVTPESEAIGRKVYKALMVAYETGEILDMEKALQIPLEETEKVAEY